MAREREVVLTLFVDPNDEFVASVKSLLQAAPCYDYRIASLQSLRTAIPFLRMNNVDLILMDLALSDSVGIDSFNEIKSLAPDTPVVIITEMDTHGMEEALRKASDCLVKGRVSDAEMIEHVRAVVAKHKARKDLKDMDSAVARMDALLARCEHSPDLPPYTKGSGVRLPMAIGAAVATPLVCAAVEASKRPSDSIDQDDTQLEPKEKKKKEG